LFSCPPALKEKALKICQRIKQAGGKAYLVGGSVRDSLLGLAIQDIDLEVFDLEPEKLKRVLEENFSVDLVGRSFSVFKLRGVEIDVSIPRRETKIGVGHKGFFIDSDPFISIEEAASRRDFSINALLYDPLEKELLDPWKGREDLEKKIIRPISKSFKEDPLRPLRAMQMIARFGLKPSSDAIQMSAELSQQELSKERIFDEWKKLLLKGKNIALGLDFLRQIGWLKFYPELQALISCPQDAKWHPEGDVWQHSLLCLNAFAHLRDQNVHFEESENLILALAVLCHDFGKSVTTIFDFAKGFDQGKIKSPQHEILGLGLVSNFLSRLTSQSKIFDAVLPLVQYHMQPYALYKEQAKFSAIRRLALKVKRIDWLKIVCHADFIGCGKDFSAPTPHLDWLIAQAKILELENQVPQKIILGRHLMALHLAPSMQFKKILEHCFEAQLAGAFGDEEGAKAYLLEYLKREKFLN